MVDLIQLLLFSDLEINIKQTIDIGIEIEEVKKEIEKGKDLYGMKVV